jgi:hypothetical protein
MTDIVTFITNKVSRVSFGHLAELEERICELEKPKGMDRVMIEEVKALVEAMLDQREENFKRDVDRRYRDTGCNSFDFQDQSRRSLVEMDFANIMNMPNPSQQLKRNSQPCQTPSHQTVPKNEHYRA